MKESAGKAVARNIFWTETVPGWLTSSQIRSGNHVILLGPDNPPRELELIDRLGIERHQVCSVERDLEVFGRQCNWNTGVRLYHGSVNRFLLDQLHLDQRLLVFNLDIEGSYIRHLHPSMASVVLFATRNPETVVATYTHVAHDQSILLEGLNFLVEFLAIAPNESIALIQDLFGKYKQVGLTRPFNSVLRDLAWLGSIFTSTLHITAELGIADTAWLAQRQKRLDCFWGRLVATYPSWWRFGPLVDLIKETSEFRQKVFDASVFCVSLADMQHVFYYAASSAQRCYFSRFARAQSPISANEWLRKASAALMRAPFAFIDRRGTRYNLVSDPKFECVDYATKIWDHLLSNDRPVLTNGAVLDTQYQQTLSLLRSRYNNWKNEQNIGGKEEALVGIIYMRNETMTEKGKGAVRDMARQGMTTAQILAIVPKSVPMQTVRAIVANVNRPKTRNKNGNTKK